MNQPALIATPRTGPGSKVVVRRKPLLPSACSSADQDCDISLDDLCLNLGIEIDIQTLGLNRDRQAGSSGKPIPNAWLGDEHSGLRWVILKLVPELADHDA